MKNKIVLVPFPFDDFTASKVRPALCLTNITGKHRHIIIAFITIEHQMIKPIMMLKLHRVNKPD